MGNCCEANEVPPWADQRRGLGSRYGFAEAAPVAPSGLPDMTPCAGGCGLDYRPTNGAGPGFYDPRKKWCGAGVPHEPSDARFCQNCYTKIMIEPTPASRRAAPRPQKQQSQQHITRIQTVLSSDGYDIRHETLVEIFRPNKLPDGFAVGAHLLDSDAGLEATVLGCRPLRNHAAVLYLEVNDPLIGIVPFVPDWVFLRRWRVCPPHLLHPRPIRSRFVLPDLNGGPDTEELDSKNDADNDRPSNLPAINSQMLHLTGFVNPLPVDISCLPALGLRWGMILTALDSSAAEPRIAVSEPGPQTVARSVHRGHDYYVIGLHFAPETGAVQLLLREVAGNKNICCPAPLTRFEVRGRNCAGLLSSGGQFKRLPVIPKIPSPLKSRDMYVASGHATGEFIDIPSPSSSSLGLRKVDPLHFPTAHDINLRALQKVRGESIVSSQACRATALDTLLRSLRLRGGRAEAEQLLKGCLEMMSRESPCTSWFHSQRAVPQPWPANRNNSNSSRTVVTAPQIQAMMRDITMLNLFQTGQGSGSTSTESRAQWEQRITYSTYPAPATSAAMTYDQRPRYGCLNLHSAPTGRLISQNKYGDTQLCFSSAVRDFCTVTSGDSSISTSVVGPLTGGDLTAVLVSFRNNELVDLARMVQAKTEYKESPQNDFNYCELQMHCAVNFARHVSHVIVPAAQMSNPNQLRETLAFCRKNACWCISSETLHTLVQMRLWQADALRSWIAEQGAEPYLSAGLSHRMCGDSAAQLVDGPHTPVARAFFDAIVDYVSCVEMAKIQAICASS